MSVRPLPWSHTSLKQFKNCPKQFHQVRVLKAVKEEQGEAALWGERVHKHFEDRIAEGTSLPIELQQHEPYLAKLDAMAGEGFTEQKIALDMAAQPCGFFDKDVWFRGVIDYKKVHGPLALVADYKTGNPKNADPTQLKLFALHTFAAHPEVAVVKTQFYWTQTLSTTGETFARADVPKLWQTFLPDLKQYSAAFRDDVWQPRQTGLCNGWCPVTTCEYWRPKRRKG